MRPGGRAVVLGWAVVESAVLFAIILCMPGRSAADPDFPAIPTAPPAAEAGPSAPEAGADEAASSDPAEPSQPSLASGHDCVAIKYAVGRVNALIGGQVPVAQAFASKELGEQAVDKNLEILNQVEQYLVYAEPGVEDPGQRAKIEAYKAALGQVSTVIEDRRGQDLTRPAAYEWVGKLSEANSHAGNSFLAIGDSCLA